LFLSRSESSWLQEAEQAYEKALSINPDYARAYIGIGGVYHQRAQSQSPEERFQKDDLDRAISAYQEAIESSLRASGDNVALKGQLGLGTAYRLLGESHLFLGDYQKAVGAYDNAIDQIEAALSSLEEDQNRLLAEANLALGASYQGMAHAQFAQQQPSLSEALYQNAYSAYSACIRNAEESFYDETLQRLKESYCQPYQEDVLKAIESLQGGEPGG
jgi:tetratricopeptide (TPR) repeat protein